LLLVLLLASVLLPAVLFIFAAWSSHRTIARTTDERIDRSLDILHEHALKVIQTVERTFGEIDEITRGMSDLDIRLNERTLHERLARIVRDLSQLQGIAVIDRDGRPLVSSNTIPVPDDLEFADRAYFRSQADAYPGTFVSGLIEPRMGDFISHFFTLTRRRASDDGTFNGIVSIAVQPASFATFYARMAQGQMQGSYFALARDDGGFLARVPALRDPESKLDARAPMRAGIAQGLDRSIYTVKSQIDGVTRRIGYRKLTGFPLYVMAGVDEAAINRQWFDYLRSQLMFGVPATVFLFAGLMLAFRRTQRLYDEAERREAAENALRQAQRLEAIGQLTGGVAHDFNNLLMIISGSVQRLRNELTDPPHRRLLDMIVTATHRGETLTRQLLTYSRRQMLSPQVFDLTQRLPAIRELLTRSLRTDIEIKVEVPDAPCAVRVDPGEFELAILNLAVNAKDAMPNGGQISIRVRPVTLKGEASEEGLAGDFIAVRIADTGQGIPADVLDRVFEPFFTTKEVGKGTGLGLSQVYGFAKQSGGTATVTSTEGRGTAVTLYLPRTHETPTEAAPAIPVAAEAEAAGTVLLVEDNADVAEVGAGYMRHLGYRVRSVANVQAALAALRLDPQVDLVFSDILMPGGRNGLDLAREVNERYPHIPVLLTTGYSASAQEAVRTGVAVLQKPYDLEALRRHIREAVERKKAKA
jgi:two-component system NtrC family sensor kinase